MEQEKSDLTSEVTCVLRFPDACCACVARCGQFRILNRVLLALAVLLFLLNKLKYFLTALEILHAPTLLAFYRYVASGQSQNFGIRLRSHDRAT